MSDGTRTRDIQNHNLELYQLSYAHHEQIMYQRMIILEIGAPERT